MDVVIQVPAFHEGSAYRDTLAEIRAQQVPDEYDVTREVWVTPSCPDLSTCQTYQTAKNASGWSVYEAPQGKLSTRNMAHDHAIEEGADVIVSWDADARPASDTVLADLLNELSRDGVVAVNSNPQPNTGNPFTWPIAIAQKVEDRVRPHINGQAHAMTAAAWKQAGPFDVSLDQTDIGAVRAEEEFAFRKRLEQNGSVSLASEAVVIEGARRTSCSVDRAMSRFGHYPSRRYCNDMGTKTFQQRDSWNGRQ